MSSAPPKSSSLLETFWDLASLEPQTREKSIQHLVDYLLTKESSPKNKKSAKPNGPEWTWTQDCDEETAYAVQRLIRGLSSSRDGARQGFALAFTEVLRFVLPNVSCEAIMELMETHLQLKKTMKGHEEREVVFGRLFAYAALQRSGLLARAESGAWVEVGKGLMQLAEKPYLREACYCILADMVQEVASSQTEQAIVFLNQLLPEQQAIASMHAEQWLLVFTLIEKCSWICPNVSWIQNHSDLLVKKESLVELSHVLRESTQFAHPRIHTVWKIFFSACVSSLNEEQLELVWQLVVQDALFESSHERKFLGFQLVQLFTQDARLKPFVGCTLSPNVVRSLVNNLSVKSNSLYTIAKQTFHAIMVEALKSRSLLEKVIDVFSVASSKRAWEEIKKQTANTCWWATSSTPTSDDHDSDEEKLKMKKTQEEDHERFFNYLMERWLLVDVSGPMANDKDALRMYRSWLLEQLGLVARFADPQGKTVRKIVECLVLMFAVDWEDSDQAAKAISTHFSKTTHTSQLMLCGTEALAVFWKAITALYSRQVDGQHHSLFDAVQKIMKKLSQKQTSFNVKYHHDKALRLSSKKISHLDAEARDAIESFVGLLNLAIGLSQQEEEELVALREEVLECAEKLNKNEHDDVSPAAVLYDAILAFLGSLEPRPHLIKLSKLVVQKVVVTCCMNMGIQGFESLAVAINPLLSEGQEEEHDEEASDEDEDMSELDNESHSESSESEMDLDTAILASIEQKKRKFDGEEDGGESSEEELLTDEQMMAMKFDDKLVEIFKIKKQQGATKKQGARDTMNFRFRALDLIEAMLVTAKRKQTEFGLKELHFIACTLLQTATVHENPVFVLQCIGKDHSSVHELKNIVKVGASDRLNFSKKAVSVLREMASTDLKFNGGGGHKEVLEDFLSSVKGQLVGFPSSKSVFHSKSISSAAQRLFLHFFTQSKLDMKRDQEWVSQLMDQLLNGAGTKKSLPMSFLEDVGRVIAQSQSQFSSLYVKKLTERLTETQRGEMTKSIAFIQLTRHFLKVVKLEENSSSIDLLNGVSDSVAILIGSLVEANKKSISDKMADNKIRSVLQAISELVTLLKKSDFYSKALLTSAIADCKQKLANALDTEPESSKALKQGFKRLKEILP